MNYLATDLSIKLRIKGASVRCRVLPVEMKLLLREGKVTSQVRFSASALPEFYYPVGN